MGIGVKVFASLFHSRHHRAPAGPPRRRNNSTAKPGRPGALAGSGVEGSPAMLHRVAAALGVGSAPSRSDRIVTPDVSAASISRRVAVRSTRAARPRLSMTSVPSPGQRAASAAARSSATSSSTSTTTIMLGDRPSSVNPAPSSRPPRRSASAVLIHSIGTAFDTIDRATAKPLAAAPSSGSSANNS